MQHEVVVQIPKSLEQHFHMAFHVLGLQDDALLHEDRLEVGLAELEHQVKVLVDEEDIHQLRTGQGETQVVVVVGIVFTLKIVPFSLLRAFFCS